ncbi:MAG: hypothetical protein II035_06065 [Firmicutes bacterium]|nr:hypothetical protein [Bacillota bacterium]MBQ1430957.1 hypothetical protein [Bacillota bacterium]MBQ1715900.1 hypothetical protein [Bacillota bacterium]MBQ1825575.1 hypothetical protein [Bacillota bacterium]MBQ2161494.1 hypothetical protein [Bacillota bacterium]
MKFRYQRFGLRVFLFVPFFLLLLVISDGLSDYIQSHYPELKQVNNMYGEPIDYWYKK